MFCVLCALSTNLVDLGATLGAARSEWVVFDPIDWLQIAENYQRG